MRKLLSIFLTFLIIFLNSGIVLSKHLCKGKVVKVSLSLGSIAGCGMEKSKPCRQQSSILKSGCCENQYQALSIKDQQRQDAVKYYAGQQLLPVFIYTVFCTSTTADKLLITAGSRRAPPLAAQASLASLQVFRL